MARRFGMGLLIALVLLIAYQTHDLTLAQNDPTPTPNINWVNVVQGINVRGGPSLNYDVLGALSVGAWVQPMARTPDGEWVLILYLSTQGWIQVDGVTWRENLAALPVIDDPAPTPVPALDDFNAPGTPTITPNANWVNVGTQTGFVRAGPGLEYPILGEVFTGDVVEPLAHDEAVDWVLIRFGEGYGWLRYDLVLWMDEIEGLPVLDVPNLTPSFTPIPTSTLTFTPTNTPTATYTPSVTPTVTDTPTPTFTATPTATHTPSPSPTLTPTLTPTATATATHTSTATLTSTAIPSPTLTATVTDVPPTVTTITLTATATVPPTVSPTVLPTVSPTVPRTALPTVTPHGDAAVVELSPTIALTTVLPSATPVPSATVTAFATLTATLTAAPTTIPTDVPTGTLLPSDTPVPTLEPATVTVEPSAPPPTVTATPSQTPLAVAAANVGDGTTGADLADDPAGGTTEVITIETASKSDGGLSIVVLVLGGLLILGVLTYVGTYVRQAANVARYEEGFVLSVCPVCEDGLLSLEDRRYRVLGIPRVRRTVRCDVCRSVLRQMEPQHWRYAVDGAENPELFDALNGQVLSETDLIAIAPEYRDAPLEYLDEDDTAY
ncbi:MAG: SH3 domain-containing protein [Anaerolineae bacterium]|nr:SH3 domain-containing protein [Anaerolineae bacterium]